MRHRSKTVKLKRNASHRRALLANPEYCLVWIGRAEETGEIMPVTADGATSMSNKECEACMAVLLTEAEEKGLGQNPAALALRTKAPIWASREVLESAISSAKAAEHTDEQKLREWLENATPEELGKYSM